MKDDQEIPKIEKCITLELVTCLRIKTECLYTAKPGQVSWQRSD